MIERVADWIPNPISERELAKEADLPLHRRRAGWVIAIAALGLTPLTFLWPWIVGHDTPALGWLGPVATFFAFLEYRRRVDIHENGRATSQIALSNEFGHVEDGWIVELTIYQGAAITGKDQGILWFENERLYFSGFRTSFSLTSGDTPRTLRRDDRIAGLRSEIMLEIPSPRARFPMKLGFDAAPSSPQPTEALTGEIASAFYRWLARPRPATGNRPPQTLGPGIPSPARLFLRALVATSYWLLPSAWIVVTYFELPFSWLILLPMAGVAAFCREVWFPLRRWQSWYDRLRIKRLEK